jgi:ABC-type lipoprotein release transport system permease subunit
MRDIRYAIRALLAARVVTLTALLLMALGIGATTAIFSVANTVLFRPLPFADPERLVQFGTLGVLEFQAYREQSRSFESLVSYGTVDKNLQGVTEPERISVVAAERELFNLLGVRPLTGRTFAHDDPANVAVVSEGFWRHRFGAKPSPGDWKIVLDGQPCTVIGIMPDRFQFPYRSTTTDVWIPTDLPHTDNWAQRIDVAVARLKPGVTIQAARGELDAIAQGLEPLSRSKSSQAVAMIPLADAVIGRSRTGVLTLLGAVVMVLLIACANVASLLLARAEARKREVAVRSALGASRGRLFRQFLTESLVLALAASLAAVFIALAMTKVLVTLAGREIPRAFEIGLDWTAFLFLLGVAVGTGVLFGMVPALHATTADVASTLGASTTTSSRARGSVAMNKGLIVMEIALAFILLTGAGLLLRALLALDRAPTGIVADPVLTMRLETRGLLPSQTSSTAPPVSVVTPPASAGNADMGSSAQGRYFRAIEERVSQTPGVRAAGFVTRLHVQSPGNTGQFTVVGRPLPPTGPGAPVRLREASPGYFRALGIPLRAGRLFSDRELGIVVNERLVREQFPGEDPIGRVLNRGMIVGVVGDVRQSLRLPPEPEIYSPLARTGYSAATLVVSALVPPHTLIGPVRAAIREINPNQTVFDVKTMDQVIAASHGSLDLSLWLIGLFAVLAFALSVAGVYAVLSYAVAARRKEFGIRLALGADVGGLFRLVLAQGGLLIGMGVAIGIAGALALTRFLQAFLYEVTPTDPLTFAAAAFTLVGVAMIACLNPARRAMSVDPLTVLRYE